MNSDFTVGLHVVGYLTARGGEPVTSETLAETYGTNPVVVRRVLSKLSRAGLVETRRGVGGGSVLAGDASAFTLRDVYQAVTEDQELLRRHPGDESGVAKVMADYINALYDDAEEALLKRLESVTIKQMDAAIRPRACRAIRRSR
ncbi:MAG: Rrf2 family transcriptional regulator [Planctomycetota bacterium]